MYLLNFEYDKLKLKTVIVLIPRNHPNLLSFLTPMLGLYGINVKEFINEVEFRLKFLNEITDIIVPVEVVITKIKTFFLFFKPPYVSNLLALHEFKTLNLLVVYKLLQVKVYYDNKFKICEQWWLRSLYYWLRIYLNLIVAKALNPNDILASAYLADRGGLLYDNCFKNLIDLKKIFSGLIFYKKIQFLRYGVIFRFSNYSSYKTFYILLQQSLYHLKSLVLKSKFLNIFLRNTFGNNLFFVGANQLNYLVSWLKSVIFKKSYVVTFYPIFYRLGCNWVKENFFINFINNFRNKLSQTYLLLKILFSQFFIKLTKYIYTLVSRVLKILYANISSINSLSKI